MSDTPNTDKADRAKLYGKIAAVTAAVSRIPKNGKNTFHMKTFLIATGDDPEQDAPRTNGQTSYQPERQAAPTKRAQPTPPATKRPITHEQLVQRFLQAQADAAQLGLDYSAYDPHAMSDAEMIKIGTEIKEAIEMELAAATA